MTTLIENFIKSNKKGTDLIEEYVKVCNIVLYQKPEIILQIKDKLIDNIKQYAVLHSPVYQQNLNFDIVSRENLSNTSDWWSKEFTESIQKFTTSGSSSGKPFTYGIWNKYINFLENESHYGMILNEFNIKKNNTKILILNKLAYNPQHTSNLYVDYEESSRTLHTHKTINSIRYFVNFDLYSKNPKKWIENVFNNIKHLIPFDIIIITGSIMQLLVNYLNNHKYYNIKIGELWSQTGEMMIEQDKNIALANGYADNICNHMRCWDGGASFFTCQYNTYHLLDNLSWVIQDSDHRMISTDFFNLPAPFINYWNGDRCEIDNEYRLCSCKRYYRPFKMVDTRPLGIKGPNHITEIRSKINDLSFKSKINIIQFENFSVNIYCKESLKAKEYQTLKQIFKNFRINYL
jgi:hypothetical protein